ncbi:TRAP transporter substrate-binding protein [Salipiger sp.]|uniref:TRAP transporter substrate-binding protein n=1 Tax=Salipiger sp. TaxID=2078585 RepID=UPI003A96F805
MTLHTLLRAAACSLGMAIAIPAAARADDITLRYSNWLPPGYFVLTDIVEPWIADVERVTEGRVKIEVLPKVVGTVAGQYDVLIDGLADVSFLTPSYTPGRFPLIDGMELPFLGDSALRRSPASWRAYEKYIAPTGTFDEVQLISLIAGNTAHIVTTSKEIASKDDLAGLKLRTPSPSVSEMVTLLGGTPISKPFTEIYELAAGGAIDGAVIPFETMEAFKLEGALKQITVVPGGMVNTINILAINKDKWNRISEADREAIMSISGEVVARRSGEVHQANTDKAMASLPEAGVAFATIPDAAMPAITEALQPIRDAWVARAKEAGMDDPEAFLEALEADIKGD